MMFRKLIDKIFRKKHQPGEFSPAFTPEQAAAHFRFVNSFDTRGW